MSMSSDEIIKREIMDIVGYRNKNILLRIFPQSSIDDQILFRDGGLTFGYKNVKYGSCDAVWYKSDTEYLDQYDNKLINQKPIIALEATDALQRGSSGNAQYQRFHHALGAVKNGVIGIMYLKRGKHQVQPDLYGMAYYASKIEDGYYLIIQDLNVVKKIIELINTYGEDSKNLKLFLDSYLENMYDIFNQSFIRKYNSDWSTFAKKRSTIIKEDCVIKYAGRMRRNFTDSSQRAGHIALGEMYLTKYFFNDKKMIYLFPRMTKEDIESLNSRKKVDKEWYLLSNEENVTIKTMDDISNLPSMIKKQLLKVTNEPLKGDYIKMYNRSVSEIRKLIENNDSEIL